MHWRYKPVHMGPHALAYNAGACRLTAFIGPTVTVLFIITVGLIKVRDIGLFEV